jgi:hypothetical protein
MSTTGTRTGPDDLIARLGRFGDLMDDRPSVVDAVLERISGHGSPASSPGRWGQRRPWLAAAAVIALIVALVAIQPDARAAVAGWLGLDGLVVEVDPDLVESSPSPPDGVAPGPGETQVNVVDGQRIVASAVRGTLTDALVVKSVGASSQVEEVTVDGRPGLWISGSPHEVLYEDPQHDVVVERVARDTLLWSADGVLYRVEGFSRLADALAYAEGT